jgi:hypothetical protein
LEIKHEHAKCRNETFGVFVMHGTYGYMWGNTRRANLAKSKNRSQTLYLATKTEPKRRIHQPQKPPAPYHSSSCSSELPTTRNRRRRPLWRLVPLWPTCAAANVQLEDEEDDLTLSENPIGQSIWRETSKDPFMSIETQGSMDSATESLDDYSPTATDLDGNFHANTIIDKLPIDDHDNTSSGLSSSFRIKDILMVATWIAFVATAQVMNGGGAVPSPTTVTTTTTTPPFLIEMTPRHFTEGMTKPVSISNDDGSADIDGVVPAAPAPSASAVLIDTPIFIPNSNYFDSAPPQQCWIVDTRIEPSAGLYGMMLGVDSQAELSRLRRQPVSDLAGVYGALVVDAPFEMQLKSDAMDQLVSSVHRSDFIQSTVDVPDNGMYGSYVGAERIATLGAPVLDTVRSNVAAWRARTVDHVDTAVYGPYLGANISLPPQRVVLESFAELHAAWSLHAACQLY